jgi:hypothetical protein
VNTCIDDDRRKKIRGNSDCFISVVLVVVVQKNLRENGRSSLNGSSMPIE